MVSHAAGSSPDVVARLVTNRLAQRLNQTFVVENRVGANGSLAVEQVSRSPADGYTLLIAGSSIMATNPYLYPKTSTAILTGLTPVTKLTNLDFRLAVRSSLNIRTFQELVAHIRANPGKLNLATTNIGSFQNLGADLLKQQGNLDFKTIPYNGGRRGRGGGGRRSRRHADRRRRDHRPAGAERGPDHRRHHGASRGLPIFPMSRRSPSPVSPATADGWIGMVAPAGTAPDILHQLQSNVAAAFAEDATRAQLKSWI